MKPANPKEIPDRQITFLRMVTIRAFGVTNDGISKDTYRKSSLRHLLPE